MTHIAPSENHKHERQPGFGVDAEFLTALSDLVIDGGDLWGLEDRDGIYVLMKGKLMTGGMFGETDVVHEVKVPEALGNILHRIVRNEGRRVRQQIQTALGLAPER